jgi:diacylglycerol kinase family enzyme
MISIMNGRRMGGGFMMAPSASNTDGLLNLVIVHEVPQMAMFGLIVKFMKGTHETDPAVRTINSSEITATALRGTLPVHADGNTVCEEGKQVNITLIPRGLEIISK